MTKLKTYTGISKFYMSKSNYYSHFIKLDKLYDDVQDFISVLELAITYGKNDVQEIKDYIEENSSYAHLLNTLPFYTINFLIRYVLDIVKNRVVTRNVLNEVRQSLSDEYPLQFSHQNFSSFALKSNQAILVNKFNNIYLNAHLSNHNKLTSAKVKKINDGCFEIIIKYKYENNESNHEYQNKDTCALLLSDDQLILSNSSLQESKVFDLKNLCKLNTKLNQSLLEKSYHYSSIMSYHLRERISYLHQSIIDTLKRYDMKNVYVYHVNTYLNHNDTHQIDFLNELYSDLMNNLKSHNIRCDMSRILADNLKYNYALDYKSMHTHHVNKDLVRKHNNNRYYIYSDKQDGLYLDYHVNIALQLLRFKNNQLQFNQSITNQIIYDHLDVMLMNF